MRGLPLVVLVLVVGLVDVDAGGSQPCCPQFWTLRGNRCYRFVGKHLNWHSAQSYCNGLDHKANLVSLGTEEEADFIQHLFNDKSGGQNGLKYWTGLSDDAGKRRFYWVGSNQEMDYSRWDVDQPNDWGHNQDCVEILTRDGLWNDLACTDKRPFICERPRPK